jgi:arginine decarboxylase
MTGAFPDTETLAHDVTSRLLVPRFHFMRAGSGDAPTQLEAFDRALLDAGVGNVNLLRLSSILPPGCREISGAKLPQGALVPVAYASITSDSPGAVISAAVAAAFPEDENHCALVMEHSAHAPAAEVEARVRRMAESNMAYRGQKIARVASVSSQHLVRDRGAAFACVVMLP